MTKGYPPTGETNPFSLEEAGTDDQGFVRKESGKVYWGILGNQVVEQNGTPNLNLV